MGNEYPYSSRQYLVPQSKSREVRTRISQGDTSMQSSILPFTSALRLYSIDFLSSERLFGMFSDLFQCRASVTLAGFWEDAGFGRLSHSQLGMRPGALFPSACFECTLSTKPNREEPWSTDRLAMFLTCRRMYGPLLRHSLQQPD